MIVLVTLLCAAIVIGLHIKVVSQNQSTINRVCITAANAILSIIFLALFAATSIVKSEANGFIDEQIASLELKVNEIYPNALNEQMSTVEIKELLAKALAKNTEQSVEAAAENFGKSFVKDYASTALDVINSLEKTNGKLSAKEALVSIKEQLLEKIAPGFTYLTIALFVLYFICIGISIVVSIVLSKHKSSEGIIYGEEAAKTKIGMRSDI